MDGVEESKEENPEFKKVLDQRHARLAHNNMNTLDEKFIDRFTNSLEHHEKYEKLYYNAYKEYIKKITNIKDQSIQYNEKDLNTLKTLDNFKPKIYPNSSYNFTPSIIVSHNARMKCLLGKLDQTNFMFQKGAVLKFSINTTVTVELLHEGYLDPTDKYTSYYKKNNTGGGWNPFSSKPNFQIFNTIDATFKDFSVPELDSNYIFYILRNGVADEIKKSFTVINTDITNLEIVDYKESSRHDVTPTTIKYIYDYLKSINNNLDENGNVTDPHKKTEEDDIKSAGLKELADATDLINSIFDKKKRTEIERHFATNMIDIYEAYKKLKLSIPDLNEGLSTLANIKNKYNSFKLLSESKVNGFLDKLYAEVHPITIFVSDLDRSIKTAKIIKREEDTGNILEFVNGNPKRKMSKLIVLPCSHEVASYANGNCDSSFLSKSSSSENYPTCKRYTLKLNSCDDRLIDWDSLYFPFYADQMRSENDNPYGMMFGKKVIRKKCRDTNMILNSFWYFQSFVLSVYIFLHGTMNVHNKKIIINENYPKNVLIRKQNYGALGCGSVQSERPPDINDLKSAAYSLKKCANRDQYNEEAKKYYVGDNRKYYQFHNDYSCNIFEGGTSFYEKEYTFDDRINKLYFYWNNKLIDYKIDLVSCTKEELCKFLNINTLACQNFKEKEKEKKKREFENTTNIVTEFKSCTEEELCQDFINKRDSLKKITTTQLFDLIAIARDNLHINKVNILDQSCNFVKDENGHAVFLGLIHKYETPNTIYGGKSRKKSNLTKKLKRRSKKIKR